MSNNLFELAITRIQILIPPSCMVVPNREIANINLSSTFLAMSNSLRSNIISEDICINILRVISNISNPNL